MSRRQRPSKTRDARLKKLAALAVREEELQRAEATQRINKEYADRLNALLEKKPNIFQRFAAWVDRVVKYLARL